MIAARGIETSRELILTTSDGARMKPGTVFLVRPKRFTDNRGWFSESYNEKVFARLGLPLHFVQDNHSLSSLKGTIRGLHFQRPPHAQAKLVHCVTGCVFDVVVDLRVGSPSFGKWLGIELSPEGGEQIFVPIGFAHGFVTLAENSEVLYKTTDFYAPEHDAGIRWNDPKLAIDWGLPKDANPIVSKKDAALPLLQDIISPFVFRPGDGPLDNPPEIDA
jgi:dTDP-4-dehydrorhamnose 3,5-epimerase